MRIFLSFLIQWNCVPVYKILIDFRHYPKENFTFLEFRDIFTGGPGSPGIPGGPRFPGEPATPGTPDGPGIPLELGGPGGPFSPAGPRSPG